MLTSDRDEHFRAEHHLIILWERAPVNVLSMVPPQNNILVVKDDVNHPMAIVSSTKSRCVKKGTVGGGRAKMLVRLLGVFWFLPTNISAGV